MVLIAIFITSVFNTIVADSVRLQHQYMQDKLNPNDHNGTNRVAFLGITGSRGEYAAKQYFERKGIETDNISCQTFGQLLASVESGKADYALLPVENTISGGINAAYDLLLKRRPAIIGEEKLKTEHCLVSAKPTKLASIKTLYCTSEDLMQCSDFVEGLPNIDLRYVPHSAEALRHVKKEDSETVAAIADMHVSLESDFKIVNDQIANHQDNFTRYLVIARKPVKVDQQVPCRTSMVISTGQEAGSLLRALAVFQEYGIKLTKLESRPLLGNPWEEMFYLDFVGNLEDPNVENAIGELTKQVRFIKVLGCYPTGEIEATKVLPPSDSAPAKAVSSAKTKEAASSKADSSKSASYRLASREYKPEDTIIDIKGVKLGGKDLVLIAGPCSVESRQQIRACAQHAKECGANILRGGCFKPRTSPYSFQGLGYEGLDYLVEAGKEYDLPVITEVLAPEDVQAVAEKADILQIGARNMQNFTLLNEVGKVQRPVMLKRGMSASIIELLQAAEYILNQGNQQVFLCERGIRTFEIATRSTLDLSAVPVLQERTHLPIVVDPSHAAGVRDLVAPLAIASKAIGAHGIMVEFHPEPEKALSDGPQALHFDEVNELFSKLLN